MEEMKTVEIKDKNHPKLLKRIEDRPQILYSKGDFDITRNLVLLSYEQEDVLLTESK